jgi:DNA processing protein
VRFDFDDPPAISDDRSHLAALRLNLIAGVGPRTQQTLLERFATAEAVFQARDAELREVEGIGPKLAAAIIAAGASHQAEAELARCRDLGVQLIFRGSPDYPRSLAEIPDPPSVLYCRGALEPRYQLAVAMVGSRRCTHYGRQMAERLAGGLARAGLTVISGLARGIDAAAHEGALAAGGRTLAVMATGLANIYPPEHKALAERVVRQGALLSESALDQAPVPGLFPQRNRIISGLSQAVIVVEAARNSGALHTVRHAMEQGREVFAVPGRIDSLASEGCHDIIRDGATLIRNADDVLQALGPLTNPVATAPSETVLSPRELTLDPQERGILNLVTADPIHIDEILRAADIETSRVLSTLTVLEMRRFVKRLPGGCYCRNT